MADVYSAIILDNNYWDGTTSWAGETSEANRDAKYSTRRYTSLVAWEADRDGNASSGNNEYAIIFGPWASVEALGGSSFNIVGWTSGVTGIFIQCPLTTPWGANPARHDGIYQNVANAYEITCTATITFYYNDPAPLEVSGIQAYSTGADIFYPGSSSGTMTVKSCVIVASVGNPFRSSNSKVSIFENCVMWCNTSQSGSSEGWYPSTSASGTRCYNCTICNFNDGIELDSSGNAVIKNCAVFNNADDYDIHPSSTRTIDYNASDDGDGTNAIDWTSEATDWAANFTDYANGDFTPLDADLTTAGIGPGSDGNVPTDDIVGNARSGATCTIGAFEYSAGGDALTADNILSGTPVPGTPAIGQEHGLAADNILSGTPIPASPTLGQEHDLTADGIIISAPVLGTPALAEVHVLTAADILSGSPVLETPTVGVIHNLTASNLLSGTPALASPDIGQEHGLTASNIASGAPVLGTPTVTEIHNLTADSIDAGQSVLGTPTVGIEHNLTADDIATQNPVLASPDIGQEHALSADNIASGEPALGTPVLAEEGGTDDCLADNILAGTPVLGTPTLGQEHDLTAGNILSGSPVLGTPTAKVIHNLAADNLLSGVPVPASPDIGQEHDLSADGINSQSPVMGTPTLEVIHNLVAENLLSGVPVIALPDLGQEHGLTADNISTGNSVLGTPTLESAPGIDNLTADSILAQNPVLGSPLLTQIVAAQAEIRKHGYLKSKGRIDEEKEIEQIIQFITNSGILD